MLLVSILKNLIYYYLPITIPATITLLTIKKIKARKKYILWGNLVLFIIVIIYSVITSPKPDPLQVEWAFYTLKQKAIGSYEMHTLLGEGSPTFLGLENEYGELKGIPIVHSGEEAQMRIRLNRKGYVYIFHFDTTFTTVRQLFPSEEIQGSNHVQADCWIEVPPGIKTWRFDEKPGLEVFLCYVGLKKSKEIKESISSLIDSVVKRSANRTEILDTLQNQLLALAPIHFISSGEYEHNLTGVTPYKVKTCIYQAQDKQSVLLLQFVWHKS